MLNIPSEVKALFQTDGVHKNFHVYFPNGDYTDLNNDNILQESVQFTESLCSQEYFKFGLAEASQIEFTAVGIPNILGAVIDCAIEIDCTSLGSAWATEHPVDSSLAWLEPQTCMVGSKLYYRIPYGEFIVDTCPRDHGAMFNRKITAYTEQSFTGMEQVILGQYPNKRAIINPMTWFAAQKIKTEEMTHIVMSYRPSVAEHVDSAIGVTNTTSTSNPLVLSYIFGVELAKKAGGTSGFVQSFGGRTARPFGWYLIQVDYEPHQFDDYYGSLMNAAIADLPSGNFIYDGYGYEDAFVKAFNSTKDAVRCLLGGIAPSVAIAVRYKKDNTTFYRYSKPIFINPGERYILDLQDFTTFEFYNDPPSGYVLMTTDPVILYVRIPVAWSNYYGGGNSSDYPAYWVYGSNWKTITGWVDAAPFDGRNFVQRDGVVDVYYKKIDDNDFPNISVASTLEFQKNGGLGSYYTYANAISAQKMLEGAMEVLGKFWKANRDGSSGDFQISENQTATLVTRSDWEEFWWDENEVEPIGHVNVQTTDSDGNAQVMEFAIGTGKSVYKMDDNAVLKDTTATAAQIETVLDTYFEPNAAVVNFTPVDLKMRGLPYMEMGDKIQLTADDGETLETYILEQTISGIQRLAAEVTSTNGELMEVNEE